MDLFKKISELSHEQAGSVVAMCSGAAMLFAVALILSSGASPLQGTFAFNAPSQAAATALGDAQSVPPGYTGQTYPADTLCWVYPPSDPTWTQDVKTPFCPTIGKTWWGPYNSQPAMDTDTFATGIFSVDLGGGQGQSVYTTRTYSYGGKVVTPQHLGPTTCPSGFAPSYDPDSNASWCVSTSPDADGGYPHAFDANGNQIGPNCSSYTYPSATYSPPSYPYPPYQYQGGLQAGIISGDCYIDKHTTISSGLSDPTSKAVGPAVIVSPGQSMNLAWSCLPSRQVNGEKHVPGQAGSWWPPSTGSSSYWEQSIVPIYAFSSLSTGVSGGDTTGDGWSPSGLTGTMPVTAPTKSGTYSYTLTCTGGTGAMTIPVTVMEPPTAALSATNFTVTNHAVTVNVGQTPNFTAAFIKADGDAYTTNDILDYQNVSLVSGSGASLAYSGWTASTPVGGPFRFYARTGTNAYPAPSSCTSTTPGCDYVDVTVQCPAGQNWSGSACVPNACTNGANNPPDCNKCDAGQSYNGTVCVPNACTNGANNPPDCNKCDAGQSYNGTACVPNACTNGANNPPDCNKCDAGQSYNGTACVPNACTNGANNPPDCNKCDGLYTYDTTSKSCVPPLCSAASGGGAIGSYPTCQCNNTSYTYDFTTNSCGYPPASLTLGANPNPVPYGTASTISWSTSDVQSGSCAVTNDVNAAKLTGDNGSGSSGAITKDTNFTLTCKDLGGNAVTASVKVSWIRATLRISANPSAVATGNTSTVSWSSVNQQAGSCKVTNNRDSAVWTGDVNAGTQTPALFVTRTYTLTCNNKDGTPASASTIITVGPPVSITAAPTSIPEDGKSTAVYTITNGGTTTLSNVTYRLSAGGSAACGVGKDYTLSGTVPSCPAGSGGSGFGGGGGGGGGGGVSGKIVTLPPGDSTVTLASGSRNFSGTRSVTIGITNTNGGNYIVVAPTSAKVTLAASASPSLIVTANPTLVAEGGDTAVFTIVNNTGSTVSGVNYTLSNSGATCGSGKDYTLSNPIASCNSSGSIASVPPGSTNITLTTGNTSFSGTRTVTLGLHSGAGYSVGFPSAASIDINNSNGTLNSFTATPTRVPRGGSTTLKWNTSGYTSCSLTSSAGGGVLSSALNSAGLSETINQNTTFTLTCRRGQGAATAYQVTVQLVPTYIEI